MLEWVHPKERRYPYMNHRTNGRLYQLNHCTYNCKYHIVWVTKYRQDFFGSAHSKMVLRKMFRAICRWKGLLINGWYIGDDHVHLYITIPPKYSVSFPFAFILHFLYNKDRKREVTRTLCVGSYLPLFYL